MPSGGINLPSETIRFIFPQNQLEIFRKEWGNLLEKRELDVVYLTLKDYTL